MYFFMNVDSDRHPALCKMELMGSPRSRALLAEAECPECTVNSPNPASFKILLAHRDIDWMDAALGVKPVMMNNFVTLPRSPFERSM